LDAISSIAGTCTLLRAAHSPSKRLRRTLQLAADALVASALITLNGVTVMCQAIIYSVALNGGRNSLVALLIATQFMEIKGIVYKRFDERKLLDMAHMVRFGSWGACARQLADFCTNDYVSEISSLSQQTKSQIVNIRVCTCSVDSCGTVTCTACAL
jgi:hypothetical protein